MAGYIALLVGESCSLEQMISRCFEKDDLGQFGLNWLKNNFLGEILQDRQIILDIDRKFVKINSNKHYIDEKELEQYRFYHPYMKIRKLSEDIIEKFDIGYDEKTQAITFPIKDRNGNCLFIARRSVNSKWFNYPQNVEKPVYGIYELYKLKKFPEEIYITESMLDCLYLWTFNKFAVALNGLGTNYQYKQLNELPCRKYILATDNDLAGQKARKKLKANIKGKLITEVVLPTDVKDINDCTPEQIKNLLEIF